MLLVCYTEMMLQANKVSGNKQTIKCQAGSETLKTLQPGLKTRQIFIRSTQQLLLQQVPPSCVFSAMCNVHICRAGWPSLILGRCRSGY